MRIVCGDSVDAVLADGCSSSSSFTCSPIHVRGMTSGSSSFISSSCELSCAVLLRCVPAPSHCVPGTYHVAIVCG